MSLPTSRNTTYGGGTPVKSADLDDMQDCIIGRKHPTRTIIVPVSPPTISVGNTLPAQLVGAAGSGTATLTVQIPGLSVGDRITAIRARVQDNVTGPTKLKVAVYHGTDGAPSAADGTSGRSSGSGAAQTIEASGLSVTVAALLMYLATVFIDTGSAACSVYSIEVDVDRL